MYKYVYSVNFLFWQINGMEILTYTHRANHCWKYGTVMTTCLAPEARPVWPLASSQTTHWWSSPPPILPPIQNSKCLAVPILVTILTNLFTLSTSHRLPTSGMFRPPLFTGSATVDLLRTCLSSPEKCSYLFTNLSLGSLWYVVHPVEPGLVGPLPLPSEVPLPRVDTKWTFLWTSHPSLSEPTLENLPWVSLRKLLVLLPGQAVPVTNQNSFGVHRYQRN